MRLSALTAAVLSAALLAAGCGGGSSGGSNTTAPPGGGGANGGGAPKKATAPNAPAGSRVVACEGGDAAQLRATAVDCGTAREMMRQWGQSQACALAAGASRNSCSLARFRCQAVKTERGAAVSCARPRGDISFLSRNGGG